MLDFDKLYCSNPMARMVSSEFKFEFYNEPSLHYKGNIELVNLIQSNLDGSNTDGSFTMANSNSFLSPKKFFR